MDAYAERPDVARAAAHDVTESIRHRFTVPVRDSLYDQARIRIARYALAPSKVEHDSFWTTMRGGSRVLTARGRLEGDRYRFTAAPSVALPAVVGESRHLVALDSLPDGDRRWRTQVDQALGVVPPLAIGRVFTALLASAERDPLLIRRDYRATMPAATAAFGRLATLDTVRSLRHADGSTSVTLGVQFHPDALTDSLPRLAAFLRKYVSPNRFRLVLQDGQATDGQRATWFVVEGDDDLFRVQFRSAAGALRPLTGAPRARPEILQVMVEAYAKFGPFTVGVSDLRGRFAFLHGRDEVGWDMRFTDEPNWHLPPLAGLFVRSALMHPFRDEGVQFRLSVQQLANGQSVVHRTSSVVVHESTIMRWLGNLGFMAMNDFAGAVEREEALFLSAAMRAMQRDVSVLPAP